MLDVACLQLVRKNHVVTYIIPNTKISTELIDELRKPPLQRQWLEQIGGTLVDLALQDAILYHTSPMTWSIPADFRIVAMYVAMN